MIIEKDKAVTINYRLTDNEGQFIDESQDSSFCYLHGHENIIPGLEAGLLAKRKGDTFSLTIEPKDGYGERDESLVEDVPKNMFPTEEEIKPGMDFHAQGPNEELITITILEVNEETIKIDANDQLAGVTLNFDIEVIDIRDADESEIDHGHIHTGDVHEH
ncbi:MAG: peptidylprolyl isomerase [Gammaproteobacteria bacterium]|nr:peptidylprolyl isomerase [Gammaproteobacteria bacterium]